MISVFRIVPLLSLLTTLIWAETSPNLVLSTSPEGFSNVQLLSVAINSSGNAIFVGYGTKLGARTPLAYSLSNGSSTPELLLSSLPEGVAECILYDAAIDSNGNAVFVGYADNGGPAFPIAFSYQKGATAPTVILPTPPEELLVSLFQGVAMDGEGNAIIVGYGYDSNSIYYPLAYRLASQSNTPTLILSTLPPGFQNSRLFQVAMNKNGEAVMVGSGVNSTNTLSSLTYTLANQSNTPRLALPPHPPGFGNSRITCVSINEAGSALMGGSGTTGISTPIAYTLENSSSTPLLILSSRPTNFGTTQLNSTTLLPNGTGVMVGYGIDNETGQNSALAYTLAKGSSTPHLILSTPPPTFEYSQLVSCANDANGTVVMVGRGKNSEEILSPLIYLLSSQSSSPQLVLSQPPENFLSCLLESVAMSSNKTIVAIGFGITSDLARVPIVYTLQIPYPRAFNGSRNFQRHPCGA